MHGKSQKWVVISLVAVLGVGAPVLSAFAKEKEKKEEKKIEFSQLPAAAQKQIKELAGNAKIEQASMEEEKEGAAYEASWKADGVTMEAKVTADGTLLGTEKEGLSEAQIPAAVVNAAKQKAPDAKTLKFEQKNIILYMVKATGKDGKTSHYLFSPSGHEKHLFWKHEKGEKNEKE